MDADILIIDEALAVGDAYFTQKCMRYIRRFMKSGSLIFVSHDPTAVMSICNRAILIEEGVQKHIGTPKEVLSMYNRSNVEGCEKEIHKTSINSELDKKEPPRENELVQEELVEYKERWKDYRLGNAGINEISQRISVSKFNADILNKESFGGTKAKITGVRIDNLESGELEVDNISGGEVLKLTIKAEAYEDLNGFISGFIIKNDMGLTILGDNTLNSIYDHKGYIVAKGETVESSFIFTVPLLRAGKYSLTSSIAIGTMNEHTILHWLNESMTLESRCTNIAAGIAGIAMHSISLEKKK